MCAFRPYAEMVAQLRTPDEDERPQALAVNRFETTGAAMPTQLCQHSIDDDESLPLLASEDPKPRRSRVNRAIVAKSIPRPSV